MQRRRSGRWCTCCDGMRTCWTRTCSYRPLETLTPQHLCDWSACFRYRGIFGYGCSKGRSALDSYAATSVRFARIFSAWRAVWLRLIKKAVALGIFRGRPSDRHRPPKANHPARPKARYNRGTWHKTLYAGYLRPFAILWHRPKQATGKGDCDFRRRVTASKQPVPGPAEITGPPGDPTAWAGRQPTNEL